MRKEEGVVLQSMQKYALHLFAKEGYCDELRLLLTGSVRVDAVNDCRETPSHLASEGEHLELLLQHGAPVDSINKNGDSQFHLASIQWNG